MCALLCVFLILVEQYAIKLPIQVQCTLCTFINIASCSSEFYTFKCGHAFYYCFVLFSFMYSVNILELNKIVGKNVVFNIILWKDNAWKTFNQILKKLRMNTELCQNNKICMEWVSYFSLLSQILFVYCYQHSLSIIFQRFTFS